MAGSVDDGLTFSSKEATEGVASAADFQLDSARLRAAAPSLFHQRSRKQA